MTEFNENIIAAGSGRGSKKYIFNASFITYFLIMLALVFLRVVIYFGAFDWAGDDGVDYIFTFIAQILILAGMPVILITRFFKKGFKGTLDYLQIKKPKPYIFLGFALGFFGYFGNIIVNMIYSLITSALGWHSGGGAMMDTYPVWLLFVSILFTAVLPGICEEITHRGLVLKAMKAGGASDVKTVMMTGLFFGLFHMYLGQTFFTMVMGCMMAILTLKSKSILPAMIMHFTNNFIAVWLEFSYVNDIFGKQVYAASDAAAAGDLNPFLLLIGFCALSVGAFIGLLFLFISRARKAGDCPPKKPKVYAPAYIPGPYAPNTYMNNPYAPYNPYAQGGYPQQYAQGQQQPVMPSSQQYTGAGFIQPENQSPDPFARAQQPVNPFMAAQAQPGAYDPYINRDPNSYLFETPAPAPQQPRPEAGKDGAPVFKPKAHDKIFYFATIMLAGLITVVSFIIGL